MGNDPDRSAAIVAVGIIDQLLAGLPEDTPNAVAGSFDETEGQVEARRFLRAFANHASPSSLRDWTEFTLRCVEIMAGRTTQGQRRMKATNCIRVLDQMLTEIDGIMNDLDAAECVERARDMVQSAIEAASTSVLRAWLIFLSCRAEHDAERVAQ